MTETLAEKALRRMAEEGLVPALAPEPTPEPTMEFDPELIPNVGPAKGYERSQEDVDIDQVLKNVGIVEAYIKWCGKYDPKLTESGESIMVSCPNPEHPDRNPSAWLNANKGVYSCAGCSFAGGDKFDIAAWHFDYNVPGYKTDGSFPKLRRDMAESLGWVAPVRGNRTQPTTLRAGTQGFTFHTAAELGHLADQPTEWLVEGVLIDPTYGMLAGEKKSGKSYVGTFIDLSVASGTPLFGVFPVRQAPVLSFVGEGGAKPHGRRLRRIARSMGIDLRDVELHTTTHVAPIASPAFVEALQGGLDKYRPGLVHLDPYYAYHGGQTNSSNLHEEGALLSSLSSPCLDAGASLLVNNHFNKTGQGRGLERITQAGGQEWCDTWILLGHSGGDPASGQFELGMEISSRQWGGSSWVLNLDTGHWDDTTQDWSGDITFSIERRGTSAAAASPPPRDVAQTAIAAATNAPFTMTQEELAKSLGVNLKLARDTIKGLVKEGRLSVRTGSEGRSRAVKLVGPPTPTQS